MRISRFTRYALPSCVAAAMLAGCAGSQLPIGAPATMPQASELEARTNSSNYKVVYSFGALPDGQNPWASLIDVRGTLYGTTSEGGAQSCYYGSNNNLCGTVFSITSTGTEKVLHSFGYGTDGAFPTASLIEVKHKLYGTTSIGGSHGCPYPPNYSTCGTVFSMTTGGTEKVVHSFDTYTHDGAEPEGSLVDVKGTLYGTTAGGGAYHCGLEYMLCGTVFSITTDGAEQVLHSFKGTDGAAPKAGLIDVRGTLYGTTFYGGKHRRGTVFSITTGGSEKVLHSFGKGTDGSYPTAGLVDVGGTLYGTTTEGGAYGRGTVFSITASGTEKVLHSFGNGTDGRDPVASLLEVNGTLYGTTNLGGTGNQCTTHGVGCGTIFSITPDGTERLLHSFGTGTGAGGFYPSAGLTYLNGALYGTTAAGGTYDYGTVFALTP